MGVAEDSGIDKTFTEFVKDGAFHLPNIINLSIKLDTFPLKRKTAKIKLLFRKGIKNEAENNRSEV